MPGPAAGEACALLEEPAAALAGGVAGALVEAGVWAQAGAQAKTAALHHRPPRGGVEGVMARIVMENPRHGGFLRYAHGPYAAPW